MELYAIVFLFYVGNRPSSLPPTCGLTKDHALQIADEQLQYVHNLKLPSNRMRHITYGVAKLESEVTECAKAHNG